MFYEAVAADDVRSIGMAVSRDGVTDWECLPEPVLHPASQLDGEAAAEASSSPAWDTHSVGAPCAVSMAGQLRCCLLALDARLILQSRSMHLSSTPHMFQRNAAPSQANSMRLKILSPLAPHILDHCHSIT